MLEEFLAVTHKHASARQEERELVALLKELPNDELYKIATGQVDLLKQADDEDAEWLEKFKGTPLMDQAIALAQQELQVDMTDVQRREQRDAARAQAPSEDEGPSTYVQKDKIRVQKKMLDLQLASAESGGGPAAAPPPPGMVAGAPEVGAQGAGALGPEAAPVEPKIAAVKTALLPTALGAYYGSRKAREAGHDSSEGAMRGGLGAFAGEQIGGRLGMALGGLPLGIAGAIGGPFVGYHLATKKYEKGEDKKSKKKGKKKESSVKMAMDLPTIAGAFYGSRKARKAGYDSAEGAFRGGGGALAGEIVGGILGAGVGALVAGEAGVQGGAVIGGVAGAVKGYRMATEKYDKKKKASADDMVLFADQMGRGLARHDLQKTAESRTVMSCADAAGRVMAKTAFDWAGAGQKVMNVAKSHPGALIGGAVGAAGGLAHGLQKDERGERHILRGLGEGAVGGATGAAIGHGVQGVSKRMGGPNPMSLKDAVKDTARSGAEDLSTRFGNAAKELGKGQQQQLPLGQ